MKIARRHLVLVLLAASVNFESTESFANSSGASGSGGAIPLKPSLNTSVTSPAGSAGPVGSPVGSLTNDVEKDRVAKLPQRGDDLATRALLNTLAKEAGWFPDVTISVNDGIVVLKGKAKNSEQLTWLAKTADRLPGVVAVINRAAIETPPISDLAPAEAELRSIVESAKKSLPLLVIALLAMGVFVFAGIYFMRIVRLLWSRHIANPFLLSTVTRLSMMPVWAVLFYLTLKTAGLSDLAKTLIGGTGAVGLILGLAFRGIAENYLAGILLAIRSPFTKGDEIKLDKYAGFVQSLNMRGTTIIDYDGNVVLIPNSVVIQSVISNRTTSSMTRITFSIGISYTDPLARALELITAILADVKDVGQKPAASVSVDKLSSSGIDLIVTFWFDSAKVSGDPIKAALIGRIKDELLAHGFHIPDTAREILFTDALKIQFLKSQAQAETYNNERGETIRAKAAKQLSDVAKAAERVNAPSVPASDLKAIAEDVTILKKSVHSDLLKNS